MLACGRLGIPGPSQGHTLGPGALLPAPNGGRQWALRLAPILGMRPPVPGLRCPTASCLGNYSSPHFWVTCEVLVEDFRLQLCLLEEMQATK